MSDTLSFIDDRVNYYAPSKLLVLNAIQRARDEGKPALCEVNRFCLDINAFRQINKNCLAEKPHFDNETFWTGYIKPIASLLDLLSSNENVIVVVGDNVNSFTQPVFAKSRPKSCPSCYLFKLNQERHWQPIITAREADYKFEDKEVGLYWRGVTTGVWSDHLSDEQNSTRYNLIKRWGTCNSSLINIGLSQYEPSTLHSLGHQSMNMLNECIKPSVSIREQLRYLLILSAEGNDVASNLKWIMASQSIPVMPEPTCESWLMEFTLKPWVNYIPIKHDTSDLLERISEASSNKPLLKQIVATNNSFIDQFCNNSNERSIQMALMNRYLKDTKGSAHGKY